MKPKYRELVINFVQQYETSVAINFRNSQLGFNLDKMWLKRKGINPENLVKGCSVLIKGKYGNEDTSFPQPDALENIVLGPFPLANEVNNNSGSTTTVIDKEGGRGTMVHPL